MPAFPEPESRYDNPRADTIRKYPDPNPTIRSILTIMECQSCGRTTEMMIMGKEKDERQFCAGCGEKQMVVLKVIDTVVGI